MLQVFLILCVSYLGRVHDDLGGLSCPPTKFKYSLQFEFFLASHNHWNNRFHQNEAYVTSTHYVNCIPFKETKDRQKKKKKISDITPNHQQ